MITHLYPYTLLVHKMTLEIHLSLHYPSRVTPSQQNIININNQNYNAELVTKGYTQTYGIDYFETFSPAARMNSIRIPFSIVVNLSWPLFQLDVKNAFLYGDLQEEVYMEQPPSYVSQRETKVCHLKKAIYGLTQSPRTWLEKFNRTISGIDFRRCHSDHSSFGAQGPAL